jgi:site-specific DNA-methyltransferase (adenine-specific)
MIELKTESACSKTLLPLVVGGLTITCEDNMELMARYPDNYFDLAIVDPPYGIDIHKMNYTQSTKGGVTKRNDYSAITDWDSNVPNQEYFNELFRVSKSQIIWGGNYFELPLTKSWIIWDKKTEEKYSNDFADCEMAWNSFNKPAKVVRYLWSGMLQPNMKDKQKRIHPTEKPYQLYKWILDKYAKPNDRILDTHLGSGSIAIACHDYKYELTACELDKNYFLKAKERIINHVAQQSLF